jgi:YfiH family protein
VPIDLKAVSVEGKGAWGTLGYGGSVELITSELLGVPHGFPTRSGGVSEGPFASLNCAFSVGDAPGAVAENLTRIARAAGVEPGALITVSQVHGDVVLRAGAAGGPTPRPPIGEADGVWTDVPGTAVGVRTADCLPILIEDRGGRRVAAVHAGWRGVLANVAVRALEQLFAAGTRAEDVRVVIGPCIQKCCFEVDGDLPARFAAAFGDVVVVPVEGKTKPHLDLPRAVTVALARAGLPAAHVAALPHCTRCDDRFFSHRRDRGVTGRHLSFITCR